MLKINFDYQVVPNQQIAGVMQPNVVQPPQVATAPTSIVQPPPTPALPTSDQPETQTPNQEPFSVSTLLIDYFIYSSKKWMIIGQFASGDRN